MTQDTRKNKKQDKASGAETLTGQWKLGQTSQLFESGAGGAETISTGAGDHGGVSYGTYQLSSKQGTVQKFLASNEYGNRFSGLAPGSTTFNEKWKETAKTDPKFGIAQHDFIKQTHFDPAMVRLKKNGIDLSKRGAAVQDALWSTSVQFGAGDQKAGAVSLFQKALAGKDIAKISDTEIVSAVQDYKIANNDRLFSKSSPKVRIGTAARAKEEKSRLIALAKQEQPSQSFEATMSHAATDDPSLEARSTQPTRTSPNQVQQTKPTQPQSSKQSAPIVPSLKPEPAVASTPTALDETLLLKSKPSNAPLRKQAASATPQQTTAHNTPAHVAAALAPKPLANPIDAQRAHPVAPVVLPAMDVKSIQPAASATDNSASQLEPSITHAETQTASSIAPDAAEPRIAKPLPPITSTSQVCSADNTALATVLTQLQTNLAQLTGAITELLAQISQPISVVISVENGQIVAAVNDDIARSARRY